MPAIYCSPTEHSNLLFQDTMHSPDTEKLELMFQKAWINVVPKQPIYFHLFFEVGEYIAALQKETLDQ